MLDNDIILAQQIVSGKYNNINNSNFFHNNSFIYKFSNELISSYQKYLENMKIALIVTASGDQILNSILSGTTNVTSCDVSRFPRYFFELKKAALLSLDKNDYLDFFLKEDKYDDILNDDIYDGFRNLMKEEDRKFWDSLFQFFEGGEIYNSSLFSHEVVLKDIVIQRNKYLQGDNYIKLKNKLKSVNINHKVGNIKDIILNDNNSYDLVNLSSILYYYKDDYKKLLKSINLNENGYILSYLYGNKNIKEKYRKLFFDSEYIYKSFENSEDGILIYKKSKRINV